MGCPVQGGVGHVLGRVAERARDCAVLNQLAVCPGVVGGYVPLGRKHILATQFKDPGFGIVTVDVECV